MIHPRALLCCVAFVAACAGRKAIVMQPVEPASAPDATTSAPAETTTPPATSATPPPTPKTTPTTTPVSGSPVAHCLFVEPEHRVVRCYWERAECERQITFNKGVVANSQTCEAAAEAHCFDENGKNELCYPSAGDCDAMVAKMKKRNRPVSQCSSKRGP